ncbi:MAG: ATP-binding protein [Myxococcales bacterium]|nr:ATP-binding protein [Myxococcales bacterium]
MARPEITSVGAALEGLVHQFADPWAFLRELVQNAIDAGSPEIDVSVEHDAARGTMVITVADAGEGMSREIIDTRLTRLFSSAKEGDYTKIGRFGIGFVSVFALDPAVVCVDTGRTGEHWRVLFRRDRTFERIRLSEPVEGTTVRLFKEATAEEAAAARAKAAETLGYWCKHVRCALRLDGERVSGPFTVEGLCLTEHEVEGTSVVMALVERRSALRGYYHGGLTLHEEHSEALPHVAFKVDSRFLEHTLTRDDVIRDEHFAKAMAIVGEVARTRLIAAVFATLERVAEDPSAVTAAERRLLYRCAAEVFAAGEPDAAWLQRAVVPRIGGPPAALAELRGRRRGAQLWRARVDSPVCARLKADGHVVIACEEGDEVERLVHAAVKDKPVAVTTLCTALAIPAGEADGWRPLQAAMARLLAGSRWKVPGVAVGRLDYPDSPVAGRVAITQARLGELTPVAEVGALATGWLASGRSLVLSAEHPTLRDLKVVASEEPELAAYLAVKSFFLHGELAPELDAELATLAAEARWRRTQ